MPVKSTVRVKFVEVVEYHHLRKMEVIANGVFQKHFPESEASCLRLYRTSDGQVGFNVELSLKAGDKKRLIEAYVDVMSVLRKNRKRLPSTRKIQRKLR